MTCENPTRTCVFNASNNRVLTMRPIWQLGVRAGTIFFAITLIFSAALGAQDTRLRVPLPWKPDDPNSQIRDASSLPQIAPTLTTGTWTAIGPAPITNGQRPGSGPVSGRLTGIAAHPTDPNTIYVAAAGGGVWKTTDGGTTWNPLTDSQSTLSMGAIAIAPSNPLVLYTGTGEANFSVDSDFGRGVLVSTDGGATWTLRTAGGLFDGEQISEIAIDPTNSNIAYVAVASGFEGGNSGVWKTTDGGVTWTNTSPSDLRGNFWTSVRIDPTSPSTLYAAQSNIQGPFGALSEGAVYKTTNGGMSWTRLTNAPSGVGAGRIVVAVSRTNPQVIYVSAAASPRSGTLFGSLYKFERSDDGGATFTDLTAGTPNYLGAIGEYATTLIVDPFNSAIVSSVRLHMVVAPGKS